MYLSYTPQCHYHKGQSKPQLKQVQLPLFPFVLTRKVEFSLTLGLNCLEFYIKINFRILTLHFRKDFHILFQLNLVIFLWFNSWQKQKTKTKDDPPEPQYVRKTDIYTETFFHLLLSIVLEGWCFGHLRILRHKIYISLGDILFKIYYLVFVWFVWWQVNC